ncbi:hypothetical protein HH303_18535 [Rhodospirillaceae bacterium KN72]|uniref:Uncharacterized protein n=1 Tax=Pacificispira spongiicola TaxID=2729598 RepID=A0A7Y0E3D7_9PROT|nr:hypothetical protein [Pacificispira spongiicola]NMM46495.1 hypothetical protein [Pacificispira spongiicola]
MMKRHLMAAVLASLYLSAPVLAQTVPDQSVTAADGATEDSLTQLVDIVARSTAVVPLAAGEPVAVDLSLVSVPGAEPGLATGVTAKGFARYVDVEGQKIAQVVLTGVAKGEKQEALTPEKFAAQFDLEDPELNTQSVTIKGDGPELVSALRRLAENSEDAPEEEPQQVISANDDGAKEVGGSKSQNDQAGTYTTPAAVTVAEASDPVETTMVSTEGCLIDVDLESGLAKVQNKRLTLIDGVVSSETECSDSGVSYPIKRSYAACTYDEDLETLKATAQYQPYYVDGGGNRQDVGDDCLKDADLVFDIVPVACPIDINVSTEKATPQEKLVYVNHVNKDVEARGCQASETKAPVDLVKSTTVCGIRPDWDAKESVQQAAWTYELDGLQYQYGGCVDTDTVYPHQSVYVDGSGKSLCSPVTDADGQPISAQKKIRITVGDIPTFITDCTPDADKAITRTEEGCANPALWRHDVAGGWSYPKDRYYFVQDGKQVPVTECQESVVSAAVPHQHETNGWQNHDDQLYALPLTTVYIEPASGRYDITTATVLNGAVQQPYVFQNSVTEWNGQTEYAGCDALRLTTVYEIHERPDGTDYKKPIGDGTPYSENSCSSVVQTPVWTTSNPSTYTRRQVCTFWKNYVDGGDGHSYSVCEQSEWRYTHTHYYRGVRKLSRDDGMTVEQHSTAEYAYSSPETTDANEAPSSPFTGPEQISWNQAEGW